jgi:hypothetical protein
MIQLAIGVSTGKCAIQHAAVSHSTFELDHDYCSTSPNYIAKDMDRTMHIS